MKTEILSIHEQSSLTYALDFLQHGEIIAFPTDTVYGLGAMMNNPLAVEKIYTAKMRPVEKAIPVLIGDITELPKVAEYSNKIIEKLGAYFWPGALTLVVPKVKSIPDIVSSTATVAVRVPAYEPLQSLLSLSGPLAVTSANLSGKNSPNSAEEVLNQLDGRIPLILNGGITIGGVASTIVDCLGNEPKILREGPISLKQIYAALK